jgi:glycosyltransferase involved in cell wall biosynthesis
VVESLARIPSEKRPCLFIAANSRDESEEAAIRQLAAKAGVDLHVEEIRDDARLVEVYSAARLFLYAPYREALGRAPLEAMACGTPVVAVGEGGVCETVVDEVTGYLVPRDAVQFAEKVCTLLDKHSLRRQMGAAGIAYVRENWTWERAADELEEHLFAVARKEER